MIAVKTQGVVDDVIVKVKRFCSFINYAMLSSRRNRLEWEAANLVSDLLGKLSEVQAAQLQLDIEMAEAKKKAGVDYGESHVFYMTKQDLFDWVGKTPDERSFPRPPTDWKEHIHPKTLGKYGLQPRQNANRGSFSGKAASLLDRPGPSGTTVYTKEGLAKHAVSLGHAMGADEVIGFKEENRKGGPNPGGGENSEKAIKRRLRTENPFDSSGCGDHKEYERYIHEMYQQEKPYTQ